jgi:hypothetical protein
VLTDDYLNLIISEQFYLGNVPKRPPRGIQFG